MSKRSFCQKMMLRRKAPLCSLWWPTANGHWSAQWVRSSFMASQHCLVSFLRQTNIKISQDLGCQLCTACHPACKCHPACNSCINDVSYSICFINMSFYEAAVSLLSFSTCSILTICQQLAFILGKWGAHSKKKSASKHLFWCFRLSQIANSIQYLEGPNEWYLERPW